MKAADIITKEKATDLDSEGQSDPFIDSKIRNITSGLRPEYIRGLYEISKENTVTIIDYILAMRT